ncbi:hypothetical protein [Cupriavidus basilensis]|uniref:hypothetical protein n=1 Tax=Cupriavidus basilensis TaxID=68895 RepID=UPI0039F6A2DD
MSITTTRKPFDLQAAIRGEPIINREGEPLRFLAHVPESRSAYKVLTVNLKTGCTASHTESGDEYVDGGESSEDLFMAVKTRTVYYNVYAGDNPGLAAPCYRHNTEEDARDAAGRYNGTSLVAAAVPVEIPA